MKPETINLVLVGFGHVGRTFHRLVEEKADVLVQRHGLRLSLRAILNSRGGVLSDQPIQARIRGGEDKTNCSAFPGWRSGLTLDTVLRSIAPGALVECTPSDLRTGEPALGYLRLALDAGWHVVTANKGPLVADFRGLKARAAERGLELKFSAAVGAALPGLDVGLRSLAGTEITAIEGILNGTTNYILTRMNEGAAYEDALNEARRKGIAEPDPTLDVEGWDTAAKILILAGAILDYHLTLGEIDVRGISGLSPELISKARSQGKSVKLLGRIHRRVKGSTAEVGPMEIDAAHPLFHVRGTNKGIVFATDTMGEVVVTGGKSDPRGAAAALLKDILMIRPRK